MNQLFRILILMLMSIAMKAQVSGSGCYISAALLDPNSVAGCGNSSNYCNLASVYVPAFSPTACGTSVSSGGVTHNKTTTFILPAGCTATVEAEFRKRNYFSSPVNPSGIGCSNSGMDGSPDALSITQSGGVITSQGSTLSVNVGTCGAYTSQGTYTSASSVLSAGCSNADGYVRMITTGGTVTVGGSSNRADELITFTLNFSGTCGSNCMDVLPVTLASFKGVQESDLVLLNWNVIREINVSYYVVEKSVNAVDFKEIATVYSNAAATGINNLFYSALDGSPHEGINYYRLINYNVDGSYEVSKTIAVVFKNGLSSQLSVYQDNEAVFIAVAGSNGAGHVNIADCAGRIVKRLVVGGSGSVSFSKSDLPAGMYMISLAESADKPCKLLLR